MCQQTAQSQWWALRVGRTRASASTSSSYYKRLVRGTIIREERKKLLLHTSNKALTGNGAVVGGGGAQLVQGVCWRHAANSTCDARCSQALAVWFDSPRRAGWPGISVTFRGVIMLTYCSLIFPECIPPSLTTAADIFCCLFTLFRSWFCFVIFPFGSVKLVRI